MKKYIKSKCEIIERIFFVSWLSVCLRYSTWEHDRLRLDNNHVREHLKTQWISFKTQLWWIVNRLRLMEYRQGCSCAACVYVYIFYTCAGAWFWNINFWRKKKNISIKNVIMILFCDSDLFDSSMKSPHHFHKSTILIVYLCLAVPCPFSVYLCAVKCFRSSFDHSNSK